MRQNEAETTIAFLCFAPKHLVFFLPRLCVCVVAGGGVGVGQNNNNKSGRLGSGACPRVRARPLLIAPYGVSVWSRLKGCQASVLTLGPMYIFAGARSFHHWI